MGACGPPSSLWSAEQLDGARAAALAVLDDEVLIAEQPMEGFDQRHFVDFSLRPQLRRLSPKVGVGAHGGPPLVAPDYFEPRFRPGFRNPLFLDAWQDPGLADPWLTPMSIVVSRLLNRSSDPMQPEASIAAALAPRSQTLVGPVQQVLNVSVIPGNTELQSPGCGARAVAARFSAAAMHCRMSWTCCGDVLLALESVPTEHISSVAETGVAAAVVFTTRPQLGRPLPRTACVTEGCSAQKPGVRVKQPRVHIM